MRKSDINQRKAREYFGIVGRTDLVLHHINPEWRHTDKARYDEWRVEDLVVMTTSEHGKLHAEGRVMSPESIEKMRNSLKGRKAWNKGKKCSKEWVENNRKAHLGIPAWNKGKKCSAEWVEKNRLVHLGIRHTEESKQKMSAWAKEHFRGEDNPFYGKHDYKWFNNGEKEVRSLECPEGYKEGRLTLLWFNNGEVNTRAYVCVDGFVRGKLIKEKSL